MSWIKKFSQGSHLLAFFLNANQLEEDTAVKKLIYHLITIDNNQK